MYFCYVRSIHLTKASARKKKTRRDISKCHMSNKRGREIVRVREIERKGGRNRERKEREGVRERGERKREGEGEIDK